MSGIKMSTFISINVQINPSRTIFIVIFYSHSFTSGRGGERLF